MDITNGGLMVNKSKSIKKEHVNRTEYCNESGQTHREDGPAVLYVSGTKNWLINGFLHRENGPAVEWSNGDEEWYINDKLHRIDGPAITTCRSWMYDYAEIIPHNTHLSKTYYWFVNDIRIEIY
jgi:hypothetical protein